MRREIGLLAIVTLLMAPSAHAAVYPDGTVLKALDGDRVYVLENGQKRWIETEADLAAKDYDMEDIVTVSPHALDVYQEGTSVTAGSTLVKPSASDVLPDLIPLAMDDIALVTIDGEPALRFSSTFYNGGRGVLKLFADREAADADGYIDALQVIEQANGTTRTEHAGQIYLHVAHAHYHLDDFSNYQITLATTDDVQEALRTTKASFCLRDDLRLNAELGGPAQAAFDACTTNEQGVSPGWADRYPYTLEDQYISIDGVEAGMYQLQFDVDPTNMLRELSDRNNLSTVLLYVDADQGVVDVKASLVADADLAQTMDDGLLLKGKTSDRYYLTFDNKVRWLQDMATLTSYGLEADDALVIDEAILNSQTHTEFVRASNGDVYKINAHGYARRILNPDVLNSYDTGAIPVINDTELARYTESTLIKRAESPLIYAIYTKLAIGTDQSLAQMNVPELSVQTVNDTDFYAYVVNTEMEDLSIPWDVAFLPNGDMLVTERDGVLHRTGAVNATYEIDGVLHSGEGGLMGIAVHPNFSQNQQIYLYYTRAENGAMNRVARYTLSDAGLVFMDVIVDDIPGSVYHDGGQIAFGPDGMLYITTGDASQPNLAQSMSSIAGKTLRVTPEGDVPSDNPFGDMIWSLGHRNAQGIAWDADGYLWATEHGRSGAATGYDELNRIDRGQNYGWPTIQGGETATGMRAPAVHSGPVDTWAPSGMAFAGNTLYFAGLRGARLYAAEVSDGQVTRMREYFNETFGRLRAVTTGPDGMLYVTTSNRDNRWSALGGEDRVIRIAPGMLEGLE